MATWPSSWANMNSSIVIVSVSTSSATSESRGKTGGLNKARDQGQLAYHAHVLNVCAICVETTASVLAAIATRPSSARTLATPQRARDTADTKSIMPLVNSIINTRV